MEYIENLWNNLKCMTPRDKRYMYILILTGVSSLIILLILMDATNVMHPKILAALLILSLSELGYLLYLNHHEKTSIDGYTKSNNFNCYRELITIF